MWSALYRFADFARDRGRRRTCDPDTATWRRGEDIAHRHIEREGMTVVARNYRTPSGSGEIDLIAWQKDTLVFVEVKCRATADFGPPERAVDEDKMRRLVRAARDYVRRADVAWENVRFDVVSVVLDTPPTVTHHPNVFSAKELVGANGD